MSFRFRLGPFTFGRGGTRVSLWGHGIGLSIPLSGKKRRSFGKIGFGPFSWLFGGSSTLKTKRQGSQTDEQIVQPSMDSFEGMAIMSFASDRQFLEKLQNFGLPWRGVQERLKEELPEHLIDRDSIAYKLVPKAMGTVYGQQDRAWKTVKRPSKSGKGFTTWIVIIKTGA